MNTGSCYRSGCLALQNKKMTKEIEFLREQIIEKNFIIKSLFSLKLFNHEEDNFSYKVKDNTNSKNV